MSELSLLLIHDDYVQAIASLKRIESGLDSMTNTKDSVADAVGHSGLAGAYRDFNGDWRAKRRKLTEAVQKLRQNFEASKDTFDRIDKEIAHAYNESHKGDQGGGQDGGGGQGGIPARRFQFGQQLFGHLAGIAGLRGGKDADAAGRSGLRGGCL